MGRTRGGHVNTSRWRKAAWPLLVAAVIVWESSHSRLAAPEFGGSDKLGHFLVFGLLGTLVCRLGNSWRAAVWAIVLVSLFGASDEWHQSFVPGRSVEVMDWIADTTGAALAAILYRGWPAYRRLLEGSPRAAIPVKAADDEN